MPDAPGYRELARHVEEWEAQPASPAGRLFYLALPPYVYPEVGRDSCESITVLLTVLLTVLFIVKVIVLFTVCG